MAWEKSTGRARKEKFKGQRLKLKKSCNVPSPKECQPGRFLARQSRSRKRSTFNVQRSRPNSLFKNVLLAASGHAAYNFPSGIGVPCRPGALTGRLFQQALTN